MKRLFMTTVVMLTLSVSFASCGTDDTEFAPNTGVPAPPANNDDNSSSGGGSDNPGGGNDNPGGNNDDSDDEIMSNKLRITVGSSSFDATLEDNETVKAFKKLLPMTVNMPDLNRNEKYYYLSGSLPTAASNPGTILTGDLMLYGSNCVVLFYESFSTSYSYTRLGRVNNSSGLASALGSGSVTVTFELQKE